MQTTFELDNQKERARTRREFLGSSALALFGMCLGIPAPAQALPVNASLTDGLARIEEWSGGRMGVGLLDSGSGQILGHRLDERFPMCSTFKVLAVAAVLSRVDEGSEHLQRSVPVRQTDVLKYAPVTSKHIGSNMTVADLCEAAITLSDNTAANLLLGALGGPGVVTTFARRIGDRHTQLDRIEPMLNEAAPGDLRDTTTPRAMAQDLNSLVLGSALSTASRTLLKNWMVRCKTGDKKIRSAVSKDYLVADKTGSGDRNTSNDIGIIWPGNQAPFVLTIYLTGSKFDSADQQSAIIAEATRTCFSGSFGKP
ncbi:MAG TPA: class A beta-lactamase [Verrucomicrobiae bacterium]|jgi:beta-lactamase class A|nr:class A beta-lactamase [Verrucomicrobiae bacterium]